MHAGRARTTARNSNMETLPLASDARSRIQSWLSIRGPGLQLRSRGPNAEQLYSPRGEDRAEDHAGDDGGDSERGRVVFFFDAHEPYGGTASRQKTQAGAAGAPIEIFGDEEVVFGTRSREAESCGLRPGRCGDHDLRGVASRRVEDILLGDGEPNLRIEEPRRVSLPEIRFQH